VEVGRVSGGSAVRYPRLAHASVFRLLGPAIGALAPTMSRRHAKQSFRSNSCSRPPIPEGSYGKIMCNERTDDGAHVSWTMF
jgi:hypothetical protein